MSVKVTDGGGGGGGGGGPLENIRKFPSIFPLGFPWITKQKKMNPYLFPWVFHG